MSDGETIRFHEPKQDMQNFKHGAPANPHLQIANPDNGKIRPGGKSEKLPASGFWNRQWGRESYDLLDVVTIVLALALWIMAMYPELFPTF